MEISLRSAVKSDIPDLARLLQMAGGGLMDAVYHDLVPGRSVGEIMEARFCNDASYSHYRYSTVAVAHGEIAGGVCMRWTIQRSTGLIRLCRRRAGSCSSLLAI